MKERTSPRILIAGVGNIFLGDDAFGVEVVQRLARRPLPAEVCVVDFGIRGLDLAYTLLEPFEAVILVDTLPRGGTPGTLYVLEPQMDEFTLAQETPLLQGHNLDPVRVLRAAAALGGPPQRLFVVGCEPSAIEFADDVAPAMSLAVQAALDEAVVLVESLMIRLLAGSVVAEASALNKPELNDRARFCSGVG